MNNDNNCRDNLVKIPWFGTCRNVKMLYDYYIKNINRINAEQNIRHVTTKVPVTSNASGASNASSYGDIIEENSINDMTPETFEQYRINSEQQTIYVKTPIKYSSVGFSEYISNLYEDINRNCKKIIDQSNNVMDLELQDLSTYKNNPLLLNYLYKQLYGLSISDSDSELDINIRRILNNRVLLGDINNNVIISDKPFDNMIYDIMQKFEIFNQRYLFILWSYLLKYFEKYVSDKFYLMFDLTNKICIVDKLRQIMATVCDINMTIIIDDQPMNPINIGKGIYYYSSQQYEGYNLVKKINIDFSNKLGSQTVWDILKGENPIGNIIDIINKTKNHNDRILSLELHSSYTKDHRLSGGNKNKSKSKKTSKNKSKLNKTRKKIKNN